MICSLLQVFTLIECSVFTSKVHLLSPGSGEQGQRLVQEHRGMCVCLFVCLFVCHWDVVKAAWLVYLFLKSPRGSFWQKAPPEQAWIRVCFGWELRRSAYEETRGEEEMYEARGLRIWLCYVMCSSGRDKNNQKIRNKLCPQHSSKLIKNHWKYFHFNFFATIGPPCVFYVTGTTLVPIEISGKQPTLGWNTVNPLL